MDAPLRTDGVIALGGYDSELRAAVLRMKRPQDDSLSASIGRLLVGRRLELLASAEADLVVPVPMYWTRRIGRGTNSPEIIAQSVSVGLKVAMRRRALVRCRNTLPQADLSPRQRFHNVKGAFRMRKRLDLDGARVLLVDDILTTGATCSEAARALKEAGAETVLAAVVARAGVQGAG